MSKLYELKAAYQELMEKLYDDELPEQTIIDTLDSIEGEIEDKTNGYCMIIRQFDADINALKEEETRLAKRRKSLESRKDFLKGNLFGTMKTVGLSKITTPMFTVNIQRNGGKRALVLDVEPDQLPEEFQKITVSANNDALRELLGEAEACAYCHLAEQGEGLRIR